VSARPAQVLLLRHAEKDSVSGNELSAQGFRRAHALPELFYKRSEFQEFGLPVALFAMGQKSDTTSIRAIQTLEPLAQELQLKVKDDYTKKNYLRMVEKILNNSKYDGKLVVICWENKVLHDIAVAFGLPDAPDYPAEKYDRAWLLTFANSSRPTLQDIPQKLLPGDDSQ
jgi:hypothetical protein